LTVKSCFAIYVGQHHVTTPMNQSTEKKWPDSAVQAPPSAGRPNLVAPAGCGQRALFNSGTVAALLLFLALALTPPGSRGADSGNCLLCHKYPGLSQVAEDGTLRLCYVNEEIFNSSVHGKVTCQGCHTDIIKIPHDPAKKVDCLTECHIVEPTSSKNFSHKHAATFLAASVHSKYDENGKLKKYAEDYPECKDCHDNPLWRPMAFDKHQNAGISEKALGRCRVCHQSDEFIVRFYNHVTTRLHKIRNPKNLSEACGRCHNDPALVARHNLKTQAGLSYNDSFHGKAASFLDERIPDCLDCHVRKGESVHQMLSRKDPRAITHPANKSQTCSSADCHPNASPKLATYDVHAEFALDQSPGQFWVTVFFIFLTGTTLLPLMGIIFLDLLRRLFPTLVLRRRS
jgi:hypothetical protein